MGLVDASWGEWPLEECGGLGNFLFCAVRSAEPGSTSDTNKPVREHTSVKSVQPALCFIIHAPSLNSFSIAHYAITYKTGSTNNATVK